MLDSKVAFICLLGALLLVYAIGHLFGSFVEHTKTSSPARLFHKLVLGTLMLIVCYATLQTGGKTVTLGVIPLLAVLGWRLKASVQHFKTNVAHLEWKSFLWLIPASIVFLIIQYNQLSGRAIHPDYSFYASIGEYMRQSGIESVNADWVNPEFQAPIPYHYGEIWLASALARLLGLTTLNASICVAYPLLMVVFYVGMAAFVHQRLKLSVVKSYATAFLLPCILILPYYALNHFSLSQGITWMGGLYMQKFLPISIVFAVYLVSDKENLCAGILPLCMLSLLFTSIAIVVIPAVLLYMVILAIGKKRIPADGWISLLSVVATFAFLLVFYWVGAYGVKNPFVVETLSLSQAVIQEMGKPGGVTQISIAIGKRLFDVLIHILPYLCLLLLQGVSERKELGKIFKENGMLGLLLLAAILISGVMHVLVDSAQLMTAVSIPTLLIFIFVLLAHAIHRRRKKQLLLPVALIFCNIGFIWGLNTKRPESDVRFLETVKPLVRGEGHFAFVESGHSLVGESPFLRNANYIPVLPDIRWYTDSYLPVNLTVYDIPYDLTNVQDATYVVGALENSPFLRYVEKNKLGNDLKEAQNRFIRENNIRFVVVQKGMDWFKGRPFRVEQVIPSNTENYELVVIQTFKQP